MDNLAGQIVISAIEAMGQMLNFAAWKPHKLLLALGPAQASRSSFRKKCCIRFKKARSRKLTHKS
jgi:hypothetical protein